MNVDPMGGKLMLVGAGMMILIGLLFVGITVYQDVKYPIGAYVSTTDEYNSTFNDTFSGHIIARGREGITVRNDNGDERVLYERWLTAGEKGVK